MTPKEIYDYLISCGLTPEGACGSMGNFEAESSRLRSENAEGLSDEKDMVYTAEADAGTNNFIYDSIGYGIAQWTWWERKKNLLELAKKNGTSVGDIHTQLEFFIYELQNRYTSVWSLLTTTTDLYEATSVVCTKYEKPRVNNIDTRYKYAKQFYDEFSSTTPDEEEIQMTKNEAIAKVSAWFRAQVGYCEKRTNAQLEDKTANAGNNNWNKYADYIDKNYPEFYNGRKNGYSWCDICVDCGFIQVFGYKNALKMLYQPERSAGAGCKYSANYYRANNAFYNYPQVGDQVFFGDYGNEGHTGFVVEVNGDFIYTIEGNTSSGYGVESNGDGVYLKRYNIKTQYIPGYGRPNWSVVADGGFEDTPTGDIDVANYPLIKRGSNNEYVKKAQQILIKLGYDVGPYKDDGDFGSGTYSAVVKFQRDNGLDADGIVGKNTWAALLKTEQPKPETKPEQTEPDKEPEKKPEEPTTSTGSTCTVELPVIKQGDKGFTVVAVQVLLNKNNFGVKYADGDFGPDTLAKVKAFQKAKGLTADGIVGRGTWTKLLTNN